MQSIQALTSPRGEGFFHALTFLITIPKKLMKKKTNVVIRANIITNTKKRKMRYSVFTKPASGRDAEENGESIFIHNMKDRNIVMVITIGLNHIVL